VRIVTWELTGGQPQDETEVGALVLERRRDGSLVPKQFSIRTQLSRKFADAVAMRFGLGTVLGGLVKKSLAHCDPIRLELTYRYGRNPTPVETEPQSKMELKVESIPLPDGSPSVNLSEIHDEETPVRIEIEAEERR